MKKCAIFRRTSRRVNHSLACLFDIAKATLHQTAERNHRRIRIRAIGDDLDALTLGCCQHHESHDAFAVHLLVVFLDQHLTFELARLLDELGRRACVHAVLVGDGEFLFQGRGEGWG